MDSESSASTGTLIFAVVFYSTCSSMMIIANKLSVKSLPYPSMVATIQLTFCMLVCLVIKFFGIRPVDQFVWAKVKPYMVYVLLFILGLYSNIRALESANVETIIVFRAMSPLFVSVLEFIFLGRQLPNLRSTISLLMIVTGSVAYVGTDNAFRGQGFLAYTWAFVYLAVLCIQMTYGKQIMKTVKMDTLWGPVIYSNTLGIIPSLSLGAILGEFSADDFVVKFASYLTTSAAITSLFISSIIGVAISWAGFNCRNLLSATQYTVVGVMNKIITVVVGAFIFEGHASPAGLAALFVCLLGGSLYRAAPMRVVESLPTVIPTNRDIALGSMRGKDVGSQS